MSGLATLFELVLHIGHRTIRPDDFVKRDWVLAQAWLQREMRHVG
jgi:hypothetical protein